MGDHTNTNLQGNRSSSTAESFSSFLDEVKEKYSNEVGLAIGDGALYLAHKSIFENISLDDIVGMNVSIIDGKGTADFKLMTPGTVIPQLPVHFRMNDEREMEYDIRRLSPWTVILKGGEYLGTNQNEEYLNYNKCYDSYLLELSRNIKQKVRNNTFRSMCYGHSENICTDPEKLKNATVEFILEHAFGFIEKHERDNYVLFINGTHLLYLFYAMCFTDIEDSKLLQHHVYMAPYSFTVEVDNKHLTHINDTAPKQMYICPLYLGTNNIFVDKKNCDLSNILGKTENQLVKQFNQIFNEYFNFNIDQCKELPIDEFIAGMFASLTMEVIPTPFEIFSKTNESVKNAFVTRLNFIATQMLRAKGLKEDMTIRQNDRIAAMLLGAVTQFQISPTAFRCFREKMGKIQLGKDPGMSNWIPDEHSTNHWNTLKYLEVFDENFDPKQIDDIIFKMAYSNCILNFMAIADRMHIYNGEMFLNNDEWPEVEKNRHNMRNITPNVTKENKADLLKRRKEKCFFEYMKKAHNISYPELIFLRQNCNVFRYKSNILYPAHYILKNVEIDFANEQNEFCKLCTRPIFDIGTKTTCLCYLFYATCCRLAQPGKRWLINLEDVHRMQCLFMNKFNTEKHSDKPSFKCTHYIPIVDPYGSIECNGGIRIKNQFSENTNMNVKNENKNDYQNLQRKLTKKIL